MPTQETTGTPSEDSAAGSIQSASEMKEGDRVVYPKQGVCRILGLSSQEISGQRLEFISMAREEDNATILVPVSKVASIGLRKVADSVEIEDVFDLLASSFEDPELDWKVRHRLHDDLLAAGGILGVAEVVKALQGLANLRPLPQKERERYDSARHLLVAEVSVSLGVPPSTAEDFIDLALVPPPGTVRPASKPRRLAVITPRPKLPRGKPRRAGDEELDEELEEGLEEEDLGLEEEPIEGEEGEAEEVTEAEEEEAAPPKKAPAKKAAPRKAPAKKAAAGKSDAAKEAEATTAAKKTAAAKAAVEKGAAAKAPAVKAAAAKAPAEKTAANKAPAAKTAAAKAPTAKAPATKAAGKAPATKAAAARAPATKAAAKAPAAKASASKARAAKKSTASAAKATSAKTPPKRN